MTSDFRAGRKVQNDLIKADSGLCLASLYKQNKKPSESTARTREKFGQGLFKTQ
jgi:hypothetical protein